MSELKENDKLILDLKKKVDEKKKEIKKNGKKFSPTTNCILNYNNITYNLHTMNLEQLKVLVCTLLPIKDCGEKIFGEVFVSGFSLSDWVTDILDKITDLKNKEEEKKLKEMEGKLQDLLSNETKTSLEIENIKKVLNL